MSSRPLISHHLFVAAVTEGNGAPRLPGPTKPPRLAPEVRVRELPLELLDFGRPLPVETGWPGTIFDWDVAT